MKCPKCHYLGFETGDRCRNCGYDFSLLAGPSDDRGRSGPPEGGPHKDWEEGGLHSDRGGEPELNRLALGQPDAVDRLADLPLQQPRDEQRIVPDIPTARERLRAEPGPVGDLPLFNSGDLEDEPLVRLPSVPRAPLAVRKTPDIPRIKPSATVRPREDLAAERYLKDDVGTAPLPVSRGPGRSAERESTASLTTCSAGARLTAALLDLALLLAVDLVVVYFTLRMSALTLSEWRLLPPLPLAIFLVLLKVAYCFAFTAIGGQTIGKMATRIRVVSEDGPVVAPASAFRRTLAAAASIVTLGGTFLPAIIGSERRAVHDRMSRTRVVALPAE